MSFPKRIRLGVEIREEQIDAERQTVNNVSFSSESPVSEFGESVILLHEDDAVDLSTLRDVGAVLLNHRPDRVVGSPENVEIDKERRKGTASIRFGSDPESSAAFTKVKERLLKGVSVGFSVEDAFRLRESEKWESPEGRQFEGPSVIVNKWTPREFSLTPIPADPSVGIGREESDPTNCFRDVLPLKEERMATKEKKKSEGGTKTLVDLVREKLASRGLPSEATDDEVLEFVEGLGAAEEPSGEDLEAERESAASAAVRHERLRIQQLRKLATSANKDEVFFDWVKRDLTVEQARNELLEELITSNPPVSGPARSEITAEQFDKRRDAYTAALCRRAARGSSALSKLSYDEKLCADIPADFGLRALVQECLRSAGEPVARMSFPDQATKILTRAGSVSEFPAILENVASKTMHVGFGEAEVTYRQWTGSGELPDFKLASRAKLSEATDFEEKPELFPIQEQKLVDAKETWQLKTYATRLSLSREAIINDDMSAFTRIPARFGAAGARTIDKQVYSLLEANPTMNEDAVALFGTHASGDNDLAAAALSVDELSKARTAMRKTTGLQGEVIDVVPAHLLVPVDLEDTAFQVVSGQFFPDVNTNTRPSWVGSLNIVSTPRLTDATQWYLAASSGSIDTVVVAGLNGPPSPELMREETVANLSVSWIAFFDAAVAALEHRGLIRNPGA